MRVRSERGSASVELVLLTPVLVTILLLVVTFGRATSAAADVEAAARDAARAASLARSAGGATTKGQEAANASIHEAGYRCQSFEVGIDTSRFQPDGIVTATARCRLSLSDLSGVGLPESVTIERSFSEAVDRYRGTR